MTLTTPEFIRRFLLHVLPPGFHRIRHYGLLANGQRRAAIAQARTLLDAARPPASAAVRYGIDSEAEVEESATTASPAHRCPCCGGRMIVVETFERGSAPRHQTAIIGIDSSMKPVPSTRRIDARLRRRSVPGHGGPRPDEAHPPQCSRRRAPTRASNPPKSGFVKQASDTLRHAAAHRPPPDTRAATAKSP